MRGCFTMAKGSVFGLETATIAVGVLILLHYKVNPALLVVGRNSRNRLIHAEMRRGHLQKGASLIRGKGEAALVVISPGCCRRCDLPTSSTVPSLEQFWA